jgi:hypothetical protein
MQWFRDPQCRSHLQSHPDGRGASPLAMTMDLIQVFSELLTAE